MLTRQLIDVATVECTRVVNNVHSLVEWLTHAHANVTDHCWVGAYFGSGQYILKSQVGLLQTTNYWAKAGVLLGACECV